MLFRSSDAEIAAVTSIDVHNKNIQSLTGIKFFVSLKYLNITDNDLTHLELSGNTELLSLSCYRNRIVSLDLTANKNLEYLDADGMESLVAVNVSGLDHLHYIDVSDSV